VISVYLKVPLLGFGIMMIGSLLGEQGISSFVDMILTTCREELGGFFLV